MLYQLAVIQNSTIFLSNTSLFLLKIYHVKYIQQTTICLLGLPY